MFLKPKVRISDGTSALSNINIRRSKAWQGRKWRERIQRISCFQVRRHRINTLYVTKITDTKCDAITSLYDLTHFKCVRFFQTAHKFAVEFCQNTTIHGVRYFAERSRHWTERFVLSSNFQIHTNCSK